MMSAITHYKMAGGVLVPATDPKLTNSIVYARDAVGNPLSITDSVGKWQYGYDANNRLIAAVPPNPVPEQPAGGPYSYDWVGNRLNPPADPNPMVYNAADQLMSWPGMHTYTYYPDGSLQYEKNAAGNQVIKSYAYTPDGLLSTAEFNGKTLTNTWDADKNRVGFSVNSVDHTFVYDTTAGIPAVVKEDEVYYIREPNGSLITRVSSSNTSYYHFDQLGSTRLLTDADGTVTDEYAYDAYGSLLSHNRRAGSVDQPYLFLGKAGLCSHYQDSEFDLSQFRKRFYCAEIGRFTQHGSPYTFASNNPVNAQSVGDIIVRLPRVGSPNPREIDADIAAVGYLATYCAMRARNEAMEIVQRVYGPRRPWNNSWENAIMHCTLTCLMAARCGRSVAVEVTNNHEKYNWNPITGPMDLANNAEGLFVWDQAPPMNPCKKRDSGRECLKGCTNRVRTGHWHLPAAQPVHSYPGGAH